MVCRGFKQIFGVDFVDRTAPVAKLDTFRNLVAEAAERGMEIGFVDVRSAYLMADLDPVQYMKAPKGVKPLSQLCILLSQVPRVPLVGLWITGLEKVAHSKNKKRQPCP